MFELRVSLLVFLSLLSSSLYQKSCKFLDGAFLGLFWVTSEECCEQFY